MNHRALVAAIVASLAAAPPARAAPAPPPDEHEAAPVVTGLDHVPVAVTDLGAAAERYRRLGFTLKPGRPHDNGIENRHVKFADGTEIELITAPEARDSLTAEYVRHLAGGDGPAFLALYAPDLDRVARRFDAASRPYSRSRATLSFPDTDPLGYVFIGPRNASPTDLPVHFEHANGAESLIAVWLAGDDLSAERELLAMVGATFSEAEVRVPDVARAAVARLEEGEVILLPGSRQLVPGRRIVGATLRTKSLSAARDALSESGLAVPPPVATADGSSIFLAPALTHGIWLEFREPRGVVPSPAEGAVTTTEARGVALGFSALNPDVILLTGNDGFIAGGRLHVRCLGRGALRSIDGGSSWSDASTGLPGATPRAADARHTSQQRQGHHGRGRRRASGSFRE